MARSSKRRSPARSTAANPFERKPSGEAPREDTEPLVHIIRKGIRCDTEKRGHGTPNNQSPLEIVVDATEGFVPLWAKNTVLRWRFRESSLQSFKNPAAAKAAIEELLGAAILRWGDACPVKFAKQKTDAWDFEIVARATDDCDDNGCVLASAFFPDAGRHKLHIYPKMFTQSKEEQIETMIHEIGHVFGLRHFFAQITETKWASQIFGTHKKFSIMNYGGDSKLTAADKADLKKLYEKAWAGQISEINGTPIKFVKPFHTVGEAAENVVAVGHMETVIEQPRRRRRR
jgi:hypothetical protein